MGGNQHNFKMVLVGGPNDGQKCYSADQIMQMRVPSAYHFDKNGKRLYHTYRLTLRMSGARWIMEYTGLE